MFLFSNRGVVEQRLSASFASHTAVTPHDWQTYEEMRNLALDKYGLRIEPIELPVEPSNQSAPSDCPGTVCYMSDQDLALMIQDFLECPWQSAATCVNSCQHCLCLAASVGTS